MVSDEVVTLPRFLQPDLLASHFHIEPGSVVVDAGAGHGAFLESLVDKVGPHGRVVACEVQRPLVDKLDRYVRQKGYGHVDVCWCDLEDTESVSLPTEVADFAVLINTLYQIEDRPAALSELRRVLRPGGILYVVDWQDSFAGMGPHDTQVVSLPDVVDLCESAYFMYERAYPAGEFHYGLSFRKL